MRQAFKRKLRTPLVSRPKILTRSLHQVFTAGAKAVVMFSHPHPPVQKLHVNYR